MEQRPIIVYAVCLEIKTSSVQLEKKEEEKERQKSILY